MKNILRLTLISVMVFGLTTESLTNSFATNECGIDIAGNQVQFCIGNTTDGGSGSSGGGTLIYGIRAMRTLISSF